MLLSCYLKIIVVTVEKAKVTASNKKVIVKVTAIYGVVCFKYLFLTTITLLLLFLINFKNICIVN